MKFRNAFVEGVFGGILIERTSPEARAREADVSLCLLATQLPVCVLKKHKLFQAITIFYGGNTLFSGYHGDAWVC